MHKPLKLALPILLSFWCSMTVAKTADEKLIDIMKERHLSRISMATTIICPPAGMMMMAVSTPNEDENRMIQKINGTFQLGANIDYQEKIINCNKNTHECRDIGSQYTALMYAAYEGLPKVVEFLVEKKANTNLKNPKGWNAYALAEYYRDQYTNYLLENENKPVTETFTQKQKDDRRVIYRDYATRYNQIACYLKPITENTVVPSSWFSTYRGNTKALCN
ncbi:ankyrin repeat domain-containing protein [Endozoicomonas lisbonensis]|uniref:Ankyrin repeat domain-containing protein n=1 Tax=Endozoicomonas lisbonensis TaxID=3120522 RepID=A0ABV2SLD5_9GAMM